MLDRVISTHPDLIVGAIWMSHNYLLHLNESVLNSNFEPMHASEIWQISVTQKLQINFEDQKYDSVR